MKFDASLVTKNIEKPRLIVLIPVGIPGMGKSTIIQILSKLIEKNNFNLHILSSDEIRSKMITEHMKKKWFI